MWLLALMALLQGVGPPASAQLAWMDPPIEPPPVTAPLPQQPKAPTAPPRFLRPVVRLIPKGLLLRLPVVDTDPNRGVTVGLMPIWVLEDAHQNIVHIHAPSIDYNRTFGVTGTYRFFYYPKHDADLALRASLSQVVGRELYAKYQDSSVLGSRFAGGFKARWNQDGSYRFYGLGPATARSAQTSYAGDVLGYRAYLGYPVLGRVYLNVGQRLEGIRVVDGPITSLPGIGQLFPDQVARHRHQDLAGRLYLSYDTRDNADTTTKGAYAEAGAETAQRRLAAEHTYQHYDVEARGFINRPGPRRLVTALRLRFDQMTGAPTPFWLDPQLGGKYSLRSYGDGRFTDRGLLSASVEQRVLVVRRKVADVWAELELAPFLEAGTVFPTASAMAARYVRPTYGTAVRVVARPQIVGSVDLGWGQEGMAAFVDINYSF